MTTSDMIRELCEKQNISLAELCRRIGQTPQNFNKKLQRGTVSFEEMIRMQRCWMLNTSKHLFYQMEIELVFR